MLLLQSLPLSLKNAGRSNSYSYHLSALATRIQSNPSAFSMTLSFIFGLLGNVTTGLVYLAPVKTFWHILQRRSTEDFESIPYVFKLLNAYFWTYYGIVKPDSVVVATVNGFGVVLEITFVAIFLLYAPPRMRKRTAILAITCDGMFPAAAILVTQLTLDRQMQIAVAGFLSAVFSMVAYGSPLSAMKTVVTTKSVEYMPFLLSFILFVNGAVWTVYAILTHDYFIGIPNGTGFGLGVAQLILYAMYYKPKTKPPPPSTAEDNVWQPCEPLIDPTSIPQVVVAQEKD